MAALPQLAPITQESTAARDSGFAPEFSFLLACCRYAIHSRRTAPPQPAELLNWDKFLYLAEAHGVLPLVRHGFAYADAAIPPDTRTRLLRLDFLNSQRALRLTQELIRVVGHLQSAGIAVLPYKGPALAQILYDDAAARQSGDLDLLISPAQVLHAIAELRKLGYQSHLQLSEAQQRSYLASGYEHTFGNGLGKNVLELKWRILPRFYAIDFDIDTLFRRASSVSTGNALLPSMSLEDLLLVLCVHAAKHVWAKLVWLCDISRLVHITSLDWDAIQERARLLGSERIVTANLLLAHKLLDMRLPRSFASPTLTDSALNDLLPRILSLAFQPNDCDTTSLSYFSLMAQLREQRSHRLRFWWRLASTPSIGEWSTIKLPESLGFLYPAVRMYRLGRRAALRNSPQSGFP